MGRNAEVDAHETVVDGDRCVLLTTSRVRIALNADHGAHLYELTDLRTGTNLLHRDPRGSRNYVVGGWYELFPNAGAACSVAGYDLSRAGDIQHRPYAYEIRRPTPSSVEVAMVADSLEMPFRVEKRVGVTAGAPGVHVHETITNTSATTLPYLWGQHITFGEAFVTADCRVELPDVEVFARARTGGAPSPYADGAHGRLHAMPGPDGALVDLTRFPRDVFTMMLFTRRLPEHRYRLWARRLGLGVEVSWDGDAFPHLWIWGTNHGMVLDPDVVAMAVEPQACEIPCLGDAVAAGRAPTLGPGESRSAWVRATLHDQTGPQLKPTP